MAFAVVNSAVGNTASLTIASATANNLLGAFVTQNGATLPGNPPTITGYSMQPTYTTTTASTGLFFFTKTAAGGETSIAPTIGSGGTIDTISYFEISGYTGTLYLDGSPLTASNVATNTTYTSAAETTLSASSILLACSFTGTNQNGGTVAWSGTGPMTLVGTLGTNLGQVPGYYIPGSTLNAVTFTANWTTSRVSGFLLFAIRATAPPSSGIHPSFL
jgi:hypothetical protein